MLNVFSEDYILKSSFRGSVIPPSSLFLTRAYKQNEETVKKYYRDRVFASDGINIIVRMIYQLSVPIVYPLTQYLNAVYARAPYISTLFNLTSSINKGIIHPGYLSGDEEMFLYREDYFNPYLEEKKWKDIKAIRILSHPKSDTSFSLPLGEDYGGNRGMSVYSIDIGLLALQWRCFVKDQLLNKDSSLGITHFVMKYVFPNMISDVIERTITNRIINRFYGNESKEQQFKYKVPMYKYDSMLDRNIDYMLKSLQNKKMTYVNILFNLFSPGYRDQSFSLKLPDVLKTSQVSWFLYFIRMKEIMFLVDIGTPNSYGVNGELLGQMNRELKQIDRSNIYNTVLEREHLTNFKTFINKFT